MKHAAGSIALALALAAGARSAGADQQDPDQEWTAPSAASEPEPEPAPKPKGSTLVTRAALMGAYRGIHDLSAFAGGLGVSIGSETPNGGAYFNAHGMVGSTMAGLRVFDFGATVTGELHTQGLRFGGGGGASYFGVRRATTGAILGSVGPMALICLGYDFGESPGPWVLLDLEGQLQAAALVWGPTLLLGWRF